MFVGLVAITFRSGGTSMVSGWPWHLDVKRMSQDHRVHDERDGEDQQEGNGPTRALAQRQCLDRRPGLANGRVSGQVNGRVVRVALLPGPADLRRWAATDEAATPRFDCST